MFSAAVGTTGVAAVFAFPLTLGAACVGVVTLYSSAPRQFGGPEQELCVSLARAIAGPALRRAVRLADADDSTKGSVELRREVHQATGMILAQLGVSATDAFTRLRAHSFAQGRPVHDVAREVLARDLNFGELDNTESRGEGHE